MTSDISDLATLPEGLLERVLKASLLARGAGRAIPEVERISPAEAYRRAAAALDSLLATLTPADWQTPVLRGLTAQALTGHLIGVENDGHRALSGDEAVADTDHIASTQPDADRQAGRPPGETRAEWRRAADRTLELARELGDSSAEVAMHGMRLPVGALLVVRAFEVWTHENDIRSAVGLPASAPDPAALRLMCDLAVNLLPQATAGAGLRDPVALRLVLTGVGGGTWDLNLGDEPGEPLPLHMVADAVRFCRLVANRTTPDDLEPHVTGDAERATQILLAASALALD